MKYIVRTFVFNCFALWLTSELIPALHLPDGWQTLLFAGFVLSILSLIVKPLLKILFIPINILTFGLLSWVIHGIVMYLLTVLMPEVQIAPWTFPGVSWAGFVIPSIAWSYTMSILIVGLLTALISDGLHALSED